MYWILILALLTENCIFNTLCLKQKLTVGFKVQIMFLSFIEVFNSIVDMWLIPRIIEGLELDGHTGPLGSNILFNIDMLSSALILLIDGQRQWSKFSAL